MNIYVIKEKKLVNLPILYWESICDLVENRKYKSMTDFIQEAVKEKLQGDGVDLEPKKKLVYGEDWEL